MQKSPKSSTLRHTQKHLCAVHPAGRGLGTLADNHTKRTQSSQTICREIAPSMESKRVSRRRDSVSREMEWRCHWGQETGHYLCMQSAGRSTPGSPDKSCSPIPPLHNRGHTGSGPHGRHRMTYQASSHWWVPQVLGRYLRGRIERVKNS